jgi:hypothetical protein
VLQMLPLGQIDTIRVEVKVEDLETGSAECCHKR